MGMIGRWIDERCATEPEVMRRVLHRSFGDLASYVDRDGKCGCLVGSYGLVRGEEWVFRDGLPPEERDADRMVGQHVSDMWERLWVRPGSSSSSSSEAAHALTVRLIKQRIRKALGIAPVREVVSGSAVVDSEALQK